MKAYMNIEEFINPKSNRLILLDNNILAHRHGIKQIEKMEKMGLEVDFNQVNASKENKQRLIKQANGELEGIVNKTGHYQDIFRIKLGVEAFFEIRLHEVNILIRQVNIEVEAYCV